MVERNCLAKYVIYFARKENSVKIAIYIYYSPTYVYFYIQSRVQTYTYVGK